MYEYSDKVTDMKIETYKKARIAVVALEQLRELKNKIEAQGRITIPLDNDIVRQMLLRAVSDELSKQEMEFDKL